MALCHLYTEVRMESIDPARVAIVDDDPEIQTLLEKFFKAHQYEVSLFAKAGLALGGVEGTRARHKAPWDLMICDLMLPDGTGLDVIERLREAEVDVPVILITANATLETA